MLLTGQVMVGCHGNKAIGSASSLLSVLWPGSHRSLGQHLHTHARASDPSCVCVCVCVSPWVSSLQLSTN